MGKDKYRPPPPPDPRETAAAQFKGNLGTATAQQVLNLRAQNTPYGSLSHKQTGTSSFTDPYDGKVYQLPQYTTTQTLSKSGQRQLDQENQIGERLNQAGLDQLKGSEGLLGRSLSDDIGYIRDTKHATDVNVSGAPGLVGSLDKGSYDFDKVFGDINARTQEDSAHARRNLTDSLAARGLNPGSVAHDRALTLQNQREDDATREDRTAARYEQNRLQDIASKEAAFQNQARSQAVGEGISLGTAGSALRAGALNEETGIRNQIRNEIIGLKEGVQIGNPNFRSTPTTSLAGVDYAGLVNTNYDQQVAEAARKAKRRSDKYAGVGGAVGAGIGAYFGGPQGAQAGQAAGSQVGGIFA